MTETLISGGANCLLFLFLPRYGDSSAWNLVSDITALFLYGLAFLRLGRIRLDWLDDDTTFAKTAY